MNNKKIFKKIKLTHVLCYAAPVAFILFFIFNSLGWIPVGVARILPYTFLILCPLLHLLMMPLMHKDMDKNNTNEDNKKIEDNLTNSN